MNKAIMDRMPATPDVNQERLEQLRALMPDLFANDGALNPDELKRLVDPDLVPESERFEFRWFGKTDAKRITCAGSAMRFSVKNAAWRNLLGAQTAT